ncbi:50S ribosomal protein L1 [Candidatus Falkowbacteria bacterium]|nr:50S ribosomal protein L1 [Candidatus Falkowbacteria bacterium]
MRSKRYTEQSIKIDKNKLYSAEEAIKLVKETSNIKFDASIEVHVRLRIDPKKGDQQIRGTVVLPHGSGKSKKIVVFATGEKAKEAQEAGADIVGDEELIEQIKKTGKCDFEIAVATPDMMKPLTVIARILGTKGLMPIPKNETITVDIKKTVTELKKGKIAFRNDDTANLHVIIGKVSFDDTKLLENFNVFKESLEKCKPESLKGKLIHNAVMNATMGPGIKLQM